MWWTTCQIPTGPPHSRGDIPHQEPRLLVRDLLDDSDGATREKGGGRRPLGALLQRSGLYRGQPGPGDGWSIRSASGGVLTGTKYDAKITSSSEPSFLARWTS